MRQARLRSLSLLSVVVLAACTSATPGWTYVPAPSVTAVPSPTASEAPSGAPSTAPSAAPSGAPSAAPSAAPSGSGSPTVVTISASNVKYEQTTVTAPAGTPFQINFDNKDAGIQHNVSIHQGSPTGAEVFKGEIFNGVATRVYDVTGLDAGTYAFVCSVHPTMIGTLTAQ